ncbi:hypothetical protein H7F33_10720 [Pedobacter sp. PAMC26386]|nr:hypothetical protein H7F33_10720 [Pedobacter sp. PAMC26386]
MSVKKLLKKWFGGKQGYIVNLYKTDYNKRVMISYITAPFHTPSDFRHQNYLTSHIVAESFSSLGYDVDIVDHSNEHLEIDYNIYDVFFGFGYNFENSFLCSNRNILRVHLITGAHQDLHNKMSLKSLTDFHEQSGLWLTSEASVLSDSSYFSMYNADISIILAHGYVYEDCKSRYANKLYSLNNNILGVYSNFKPKISRSNNFLFLCGGRQITKGLTLLLETAKLRKDLNFYLVIPSISGILEDYYGEVLDRDNVYLFKNIGMNSDEMIQIINKCSYSVAPSYTDGMPGGTIEPMSAGLIPIVSKFCGFDKEEFIFVMEDLSVQGLNDTINRVLKMTDDTYFCYSNAVKNYAIKEFSSSEVKKELIRILEVEISE